MSRLSTSVTPRLLIVLLLSLLTTACGFQFRGSYLIPEEVSALSLTSFDPYGKLTRYVQNELHMNGVDMVQPAANIPNLHLISETQEQRTLSLYQNSRAAEYELTYTVNYRVTIAEVGSQTFTTSVNRSYLDNPMAALAKSEEKEMTLDEMRLQAARQILRQMARLKARLEKAEQLTETEQLDEGVTQTTTTEAVN